MDSNKKMRNSGIELLRILAMFMIVFHHFAIHGNFAYASDLISINKLWIQFIQGGGKIGVNIFVLISGYYLSKQKCKKMTHIMRMWWEVFFYSVFLYLFVCWIGGEEWNIVSFIKSLMPITFVQYGYASSYFVLYLIFPVLNIIIENVSKDQYKHLLFTSTILWCVLPSITSQPYESNNLIWFIYLYFVAAYLRQYGINISQHKNKTGIIYALLANYILVLLVDVIGLRYPIVGRHATHFYGAQSLLVVISSILIFNYFLQFIKLSNKIINMIASATFGVYLIHDNMYIRGLLWGKVFKNAEYMESPSLIIYSILAVSVVYVGCTFIEEIRQQIAKILNEFFRKIKVKFAD